MSDREEDDRVEFDDEEEEAPSTTMNKSTKQEGDDNDDEDNKNDKKYSIQELFGSDSEEEEEEDEERQVDSSRSRTTPFVSSIDIPPVQPLQSKHLSLFKLPLSLRIEPRIYSREQILNRSEYLDQNGEQYNFHRTSTIRWRNDPESNNKRESNARIVKWSDGSFTLHVGNETFDMNTREMKNDHSHLYNRLTNNVIYGQGKFTKRLTFQPTTNRMATIQASSKKKTQQQADAKRSAKLTFVSVDPEHEEALSHNIKKQVSGMNSKRQKIAAKNARNMKNVNAARLSNRMLEEGLASDEEEEDDDNEDQEGNIGAMKKKYKKKQQKKRKYRDEEEEDEEEERGLAYDDEEEEEEEEAQYSEGSEEEEDEEEDEEEEEEEEDSKKHQKKKARR